MSNMSFTEKLNRTQVEANCPKNQYNSFGKYNYRSCEDILEGLKPFLKSYGLIVTVTDEVILIGERYYIKATSTITDGENSYSTVSYARENEEKKGMDPSQVTGATSSYARKYSLQGLLALDDNKDADATNTHNESNGQKDAAQNNKSGNNSSQGQKRGSGQASKNSGQDNSEGNQSGNDLLPRIEGVTFEEIQGKDGNMYLIAKGDTYNKKSQLDKLSFKRTKNNQGNWVVYRPKQQQVA